jgi:hypothetical protein
MTKLTNRNAPRARLIHPKLPSYKLTEAQLIVLSGAAQRKDRAATMPEGMKDSAAHKLGTTLIEKGLAREVRAKSGMPAWRRSEEGGPLALIITKLGRSTIKVDEGDAKSGADAERVAASSKQAVLVQPVEAGHPTPGQQACRADSAAQPQQGRQH